MDSIQRYLGNLQGEVDSATLYRALSESEADPHLREIYRRLAGVEEAHAEFWRKRLAQTGAQPRVLHAGLRARALAWLARRFGPQFVLPDWTAPAAPMTRLKLETRPSLAPSTAARSALPPSR